MGYVIAIAGKGGTGKTTIAALILKVIKDKKLGSLLAVDADPNSNLGEALGQEAKETVGSIINEVAAHPDQIPAGMSKDRFIEYRLQTAIREGDGFDLLTMGRPEGPGCYCYVNNVLRNIVAKLIKEYDYVVIDNEAGLEHFSRRTTGCADTLVVISDYTKVGLRSAKRIKELVDELGVKVKNKLLIINRSSVFIDRQAVKNTGLNYIGEIPEDKSINKINQNGGSLLSLTDKATSLKMLRKIGDVIWQKN
ncbi:MAG: hypothetical protein A2166_01865 [Omnitrophica WOR_2 bacterium RBG_13_41_10]|nr:MAG: hypothetical protein A2166_01865 [Omnitrophica WOR_2 bacterium RBG_13_41_10]